jgi:hypothetical protein
MLIGQLSELNEAMLADDVSTSVLAAAVPEIVADGQASLVPTVRAWHACLKVIALYVNPGLLPVVTAVSVSVVLADCISESVISLTGPPWLSGR